MRAQKPVNKKTTDPSPETEAKPTTYVFYRLLIFALDYAVDKHKHCLAHMYVP